MNTFQDYAAAATSYVAAALALFVDHSNALMQIFGFILLVARLVKEVPSAYRMIKGWLARD